MYIYCMRIYYIVGTLKFSWPVLIPEYIRAHNYGKECNGLYFFHGPVHTHTHTCKYSGTPTKLDEPCTRHNSWLYLRRVYDAFYNT